MCYVFIFLFLATVRRFLLDIPFPSIPSDRVKSFDPLLGNLSLIAIIFVSIYTLYSGTELLWKNWEKLKLD
jgi:hypothetical protein